MATMVGGEYSGDYPFANAFDSNYERSSFFHSAAATPSAPQGVEINFGTIKRVYEVTILPRDSSLFR